MNPRGGAAILRTMPFARANGIDVCYDEHGEGEPLVLIMGIGAQLVHWPDGFVDELSDRGFRVIRMDNRDVGQSTWFPDLGVPSVPRLLARRMVGLPVQAPYTMNDMVDDVVGLLDALGLETAHVFGASMGGMIAQAMAIRAPQRVRSLISFMSTPGGLRWLPTPRAAHALLRGPARNRKESIDHALHFFRVVGGKGYPPRPEVIADITGRAFDRGYNPAGFARQMAAIMADGDRTRRLADVRVPTLVIHGMDDPLLPLAAGRATARAVPGARFLPVPGVGHDVPRGAWPILADAVRDHALK